jgi:hypothetical protein
MPRNRVQHQKGLSDDALERLYPDEEACRKAWFAWRWPEGFKCPRCAGLKYCEPAFAVCGRPPPRKVFCSAFIRSLAPVCPAYLRART